MGNKSRQPKRKKNNSGQQQVIDSSQDDGDLRIAAAEAKLLAIRQRLQSVATELSEIKALLLEEQDQDQERPSQIV